MKAIEKGQGIKNALVNVALILNLLILFALIIMFGLHGPMSATTLTVKGW